MGKVKSVTLKEAFAPISEAIKAGYSADELLNTLDQLKQSMCAKEVTVVQSDESFEERAATLAENMGLKEYTLEYSDGKAVEVKRCDSLMSAFAGAGKAMQAATKEQSKKVRDSLLNAFTYAIPYVENKEADYLTALTDKARELMDVASMGFGSEEHIRDLTCHIAQYAKDLCADLGPSEDNKIGDIPNLDCAASLADEDEPVKWVQTVNDKPAFYVECKPIKLSSKKVIVPTKIEGVNVIHSNNGIGISIDEEPTTYAITRDEPAPLVVNTNGPITTVEVGNTPTQYTPAPHEVTNHDLPTNEELAQDLPDCTPDHCTCSSRVYTDGASKYAYVADIHKDYMEEQHLTVLEIQAVIKEVEEVYDIMNAKWNEALSVLSSTGNDIDVAEHNEDNYLIHLAYLKHNEAIEEEAALQEEVNELTIRLNELKAHAALEKHKEQLSKVTYEGLMIAHDYKANS